MTTSPSIALMAERLQNAQRILAVAHINPDGDAIGSVVAIGHIALALGKEVRFYCVTPIADHLSWLQLPVPLVQAMDELGAWQPDMILFMDCADERRAGQEMMEIASVPAEKRPWTTTCIDHHTDNPHFADTNLIDPAQPATGLLVGLLAKRLGIPLSGALGEALFLTLVSDTGSFSYGNTNAAALSMAAEIVGNGLSVAHFTTQYENNWSLNRLHLWGQLMGEVTMHCNGAVAASVVTQAHLDKMGAHRADLEGFASWLRRLKGVRVVLFSRVSNRGAKLSLRSMGDVDIRVVAAKFGGGGHVAAAGIEMDTTPEKAAELVLAELEKHLC